MVIGGENVYLLNFQSVGGFWGEDSKDFNWEKALWGGGHVPDGFIEDIIVSMSRGGGEGRDHNFRKIPER